MIVSRWLFFTLVIACTFCHSAAHAHLMVSQRGTLNIIDSGAYVVLSLPVSAFTGIDDDEDGKLSLLELRAHTASIEEQIQLGVQLVSTQGKHLLNDLILNTSPPDNAPFAAAEQIVVMGRFPIDGKATDLKLIFRLFGKDKSEQVQQITATRGAETQLMTLTPQFDQIMIFPPLWRIFYDQVVSGTTHILAGADHLLFLLVVLSAGWSFKKVVIALTCFTAGHATTLIASTWLGLVVSPTIVEPAIAATIVGMALFDRYCLRNKLRFSTGFRLSLVFGCALIHGLGLAGAFTSLGLNTENKFISLVGFNVGIELGQLVVVLVAAGMTKLIYTLFGVQGMKLTTRLTSVVAVLMGTLWLLERIISTYS